MTQKCPNKIPIKISEFNQEQKLLGFRVFFQGGGKMKIKINKQKNNHAQLASGKFDYLPLPVHPLHRQC